MMQHKEKIVIEQPSFFPWCGYMGLISVADIFVIYDDVQFERRSWQSRNRIISSDQEWMYINVPTVKAPRETAIKDILISPEENPSNGAPFAYVFTATFIPAPNITPVSVKIKFSVSVGE